MHSTHRSLSWCRGFFRREYGIGMVWVWYGYGYGYGYGTGMGMGMGMVRVWVWLWVWVWYGMVWYGMGMGMDMAKLTSYRLPTSFGERAGEGQCRYNGRVRHDDCKWGHMLEPSANYVR